MWSNEIIHFWTAVVDESEEWSSQWIFQFKQLERSLKIGKNWKNWKELYCLTTHFERKTRDIIFHSQHIPSPRDIFPYTETLNFLIIISKILRY